MLVNEIRGAVIDTINFLLPPLGKVLATLVIAYYVTYGYLTDYFFIHTKHSIDTFNIDNIKAIVEKLYLTSVIPFIFILILVAIAYLINLISSFLSSLVPLTFNSTGQLANHHYTKYIWTYFSDISSLYGLELKVNEIIEKIKAEQKHPFVTTLDYQYKSRNKDFIYLNLFYFLVIVSIACYWIAKHYLYQDLSSKRLFFVLVVLLFAIAIFFIRIAYGKFRTREIELFVVEQYLNNDKRLINEYLISNEIVNKIEDANKYSSKWWWVGITYNLAWLRMLKFYKLPFYENYKISKIKNMSKKDKRYR